MKDKLVEQFYQEPHADGAVYYAKRGRTNIKAVDWDEEKDRLYPIVPEFEKAKNRACGFEKVDRNEVPDRIEEYLEDQFVNPQELAAALKSFGKEGDVAE